MTHDDIIHLSTFPCRHLIHQINSPGHVGHYLQPRFNIGLLETALLLCLCSPCSTSPRAVARHTIKPPLQEDIRLPWLVQLEVDVWLGRMLLLPVQLGRCLIPLLFNIFFAPI